MTAYAMKIYCYSKDCVLFFCPGKKVNRPNIIIRKLTNIPRNRGSIFSGRINLPINTKIGPKIIDASAKFLLTFPFEKIAVQSGANTVAPRKPMDMKLHLRIRDFTFPVVKTTANKSMIIIALRVVLRSFTSLAVLFI